MGGLRDEGNDKGVKMPLDTSNLLCAVKTLCNEV